MNKVGERIEVALVASARDWVIIRTGDLCRETPGGITLGSIVAHGPLAESTLADLVAIMIRRAGVSHLILEATNGETRVDSAVDDHVSYLRGGN